MINRRYTVLKKIGEGRSSVFLCHDKYFNKDVAVKLLSPSSSKNEIFAFKDEFLSLKKINHPNIASVFDYGTVLKLENNPNIQTEFAGSKFITLEYINGTSLLEYCLKKDFSDIDEIVSQICHTLFFLHQSNMIYMDLKFDNILVKEENDKPVVKFIDFGFVQNTRKLVENSKKGTPYYIAPEILQDKKVDHRADFYSLGIMLYRIFTGEFPFTGKDEIEIYKAHIENELDISGDAIPVKYIPVIKKLCSKEAEHRYLNALGILDDLKIDIDEESLKKWDPVRTYVINNAAVDFKNFLLLNEPDFIKVIKGVSLSGKTSLVEEIAYNFDGVVLISPHDFQANMPNWKSFLNKILFSEYIYQYIGNFLINRILRVIQEEPNNISDELKSIFINLSQRVKFSIIFDDFNKYDPITIQFLVQLFPIFLVNKVRTVVVENEDYPSVADLIAAPAIRKLDPFTEEQVQSLLVKTFNDEFPFDSVAKLIYQNCDLYPGAILSFIKDLIYSQAIKFTSKGIISDDLQGKSNLLKENQFIFYEARTRDLSDEEKRALKFLSLFETDVTCVQIQETFEGSNEDLAIIFNSLLNKKLILEANNGTVHFTSLGFKNYIYSTIADKEKEHRAIALKLLDNEVAINKIELARQFELGKDFNSTFDVIINYLDEITRYETYKYQFELLERLSRLKLSRAQNNEVKIRLCEVYYKLGDLKSSFAILKQLLAKNIKDVNLKEKLLLRMGECLIGLGNINQGLEVFNGLLNTVTDKNRKIEIQYEIASAQTYSDSVNEAEEVLLKLIKDKNIYPELKAKSLNLLGIVEAQNRNNVKTAVTYFSEALAIYEKEKMGLKEAQVTKNIGNVYYMEGNYKEAEVYWKKSLNKNLEIGNLEEEATLLNNYGVLHFKNLDLEKSSENYKRALTIYRSLGRKFGEGLGYSNLGESFYLASEYDSALNCLEKAKMLFKEIGDISELSEVLLLKGYLLKSVNDNPGLAKLVVEFKELIGQKNNSQKSALHFKLLEVFLGGLDFHTASSRLSKLRDEYLTIGEVGHFQKTTALFCEYLMSYKKIGIAQNIISSNEFLDTIQDMPYFKAYERYLLGKITYELKNESLKSNLEYYEEGYKILHECSITELTWKIIAALAEAYMDRGNINKAVEYIHLTKSLLNHISMNIKDIRLRSLYLSTPERKATLEKLSIWETFIK